MSLKEMLNTLFQSNEMTAIEEDSIYIQEQEETRKGDMQMAPSTQSTPNVVHLNDIKNNKQAMIDIYYPRVFSEAERMGQVLLDGKAILLNFSRMNEEDARRFIDYLAGVVYAIEGDMQRVATNVFIATPRSFVISGELESFESNKSKKAFERKED